MILPSFSVAMHVVDKNALCVPVTRNARVISFFIILVLIQLFEKYFVSPGYYYILNLAVRESSSDAKTTKLRLS